MASPPRASIACPTLLCATLCLTFAVHAQQRPPTAGDALRDTQDKPAVPRTGTPTIEVAPEKRRAVKAIDGVKIGIKSFRFSGVTSVPEEELQRVVAGFVGPDKTFEDMQGAADAVSEYLQRRGYFVAQAYLPEQKVDAGTIEIAVLEGRLAKLSIEMDESVPVFREIVEGLV